jgi:hypothetical protein
MNIRSLFQKSKSFVQEKCALWWIPGHKVAWTLFFVIWYTAIFLSKVRDFAKETMEKHGGVLIGSVTGGLIAILVGKFFFPFNQDWQIFTILVGYCTGGFLGELVSPKISAARKKQKPRSPEVGVDGNNGNKA